MIARIWHGFTEKEKANAYELLLTKEIFAWIESKRIKGYRGIQLLRKETSDETAFITIMWFDQWQSVIDFAGVDYETAIVLPAAQSLLKRYDAKSEHYEVVTDQRT